MAVKEDLTLEKFDTLQKRFSKIAMKTKTSDLNEDDIAKMQTLTRKMNLAISRELSELDSFR